MNTKILNKFKMILVEILIIGEKVVIDKHEM